MERTVREYKHRTDIFDDRRQNYISKVFDSRLYNDCLIGLRRDIFHDI